MILLFENIIKGRIGSVQRDTILKKDEQEKLSYVHANKLLDWALIQSLTYDEIRFDEIANLQKLLITFDKSDVGYLLEVNI